MDPRVLHFRHQSRAAGSLSVGDRHDLPLVALPLHGQEEQPEAVGAFHPHIMETNGSDPGRLHDRQPAIQPAIVVPWRRTSL
jgi:hypothetical protein